MIKVPDNKIYLVRVYDENDHIMDWFRVELPEGSTGNGVMKQVERDYPGCDWSMMEVNNLGI